MRDYELVAVLNPTLSQEGATASWERIKRAISDRGGELLREEHWGTRRLAYPITRASQRFTEGNYYFSRFHLEAKGATELENSLRLAEDVVRFLVVKAEGPLPPPRPTPQELAAAAAAQAAAAQAAAAATSAAAPVSAAPQPAPAPAPAKPAAEAPATPAPEAGPSASK